jgi:hypothetical protein
MAMLASDADQQSFYTHCAVAESDQRLINRNIPHLPGEIATRYHGQRIVVAIVDNVEALASPCELLCGARNILGFQLA